MESGAKTNGLGYRLHVQSHGWSLGHGDTRRLSNRVASVCPELSSGPSHAHKVACGHYGPTLHVSNRRLAIRNMTQLIENKQSGPFLINYFLLILRPSNPRLHRTVAHLTDYYSPLTNHYLRRPCAGVARGGKMDCFRARTTRGVRQIL
jgi:hypothetical protein